MKTEDTVCSGTLEDGLEPGGTVAAEQETLRPLSLRVNFSWTFAGNVVYAASQWGMLVVLAKLGTPEMVGRFALGLAVTAPVIMFANLQLRAVQATDAKDEYSFGYYLGLRLITTVLAFLVILGITALSGYSRETALVILIVGAAKCFEAVSDVIYGLMQKHERMDRIARSMMLKGPLSLAALGLAVYLTGSVAWGAAALCGVWMVLLLTYDIRNGMRLLYGMAKDFRPRWNKPGLGRLAWLALPLGIVMMLISLNASIPRFFVEHYCGEDGLGYFAALAYLMVAGSTVVSALGQSASPRLARSYIEDIKQYRTLLIKLIGIGMVLGMAAILIVYFLGREILTLLYRPEYATYLDVLVWLAIAAALNFIASFLGYGMTAVRYFKVQVIIFGSTTLLTTGACAWLIPGLGLKGAAMAFSLAALFQLTASAAVNIHAITRKKVEGNA